MAKLKVDTLRTQPYTPTSKTPPPPLEDEDPGGVTLSLEELRRVGGPLTREILDAIAARQPLGRQSVDLAEEFSQLDVEQRRPVEIAGLVQLATSLGVSVGECDRATYACVSIDGSSVQWEGPRIILTLPQMDEGRGVLT